MKKKIDLSNSPLILRKATLQDADFLLELRNDLDTRIASHEASLVKREDHVIWLSKTLRDKNRQLFLAEISGIAVGTIRSDFLGDTYELSWSVSPDVRGQGIGKLMVNMLASQILEPISAEIKKENYPSVKIAQSVGMEFTHEVNGILHFKRDAVNQ